MNLESDNKLITCLIPKGKGVKTISALKDEKQVNSANVYSGRSNLFRADGHEIESETLAVVVPEERAEEIFSFLYEQLEIDSPNNGILFHNPLSSTTQFSVDHRGQDTSS